MNKAKLKKIIDKYRAAEEEIIRLDSTFGICLYNSKNENFYNKYNYVIFKLFDALFGAENREIIEDYIFEQTDITFEELCKALNIND